MGVQRLMKLKALPGGCAALPRDGPGKPNESLPDGGTPRLGFRIVRSSQGMSRPGFCFVRMFVVRLAYASLGTVMALVLAGSVASAATVKTFGRSDFAAQQSARYLQTESFDEVPLGPIADTSPVSISASEGAVVVTSLFRTTSGPQGIGWGDRQYFSAAQSVTFNFTIAISAFACRSACPDGRGPVGTGSAAAAGLGSLGQMPAPGYGVHRSSVA